MRGSPAANVRGQRPTPITVGIQVSCPHCKRTRRAVRAGTYGWRGQRRQLLKCTFCTRRFAEPLPRAVIAPGSTCIECLNGLGPHQGHPHPRKYHFTAPVIATALGRIATGTSYRGAGEQVREKNDRLRRIQTAGVATKYPWREDGNLVLDWVETYTEPLWDAFGPKTWPDIISVDELIVNGRSPSARRQAALMYPASSFAAPLTQAGRPPRTKGGRRLFTIIGAHGYPAQARPRPWLFHACPTATVAEWVAFFRSLAGQPQIVVGDAGHAWQLAVPLAWPSNPPEMVISEFHLREMLDSHIRRLKVPDGDPLIAMTMAAFRGPTDWAVLVAALTPTAQRDARLRAWLAKWDTRVATQLSRHAYRTVTKTTGGIETALKVLERKIHHRRHMFANRARTNLMLKLMTLEARGAFDERGWSATVRTWLVPRGGRPPIPRQITDHVGGPRKRSSLRQGGASK